MLPGVPTAAGRGGAARAEAAFSASSAVPFLTKETFPLEPAAGPGRDKLRRTCLRNLKIETTHGAQPGLRRNPAARAGQERGWERSPRRVTARLGPAQLRPSPGGPTTGRCRPRRPAELGLEPGPEPGERAVPCRREVRAVLGMRAPRGAQRCGDRCWGRAGPELRGYRWDRARSGAPWGGAACGPGRAASRGRRRVGAVPYGAVTDGAALGAAALYFLREKKKGQKFALLSAELVCKHLYKGGRRRSRNNCAMSQSREAFQSHDQHRRSSTKSGSGRPIPPGTTRPSELRFPPSERRSVNLFSSLPSR